MKNGDVTELTAFRRDILAAIYKLSRENDYPKGQTVRHVLEDGGYDAVQGGHLYPEINALVEDGYLEKTDHPTDKRANAVTLTQRGHDALRQQALWVGDTLDLDITRRDLPENLRKLSLH